MNRDGSGKRQLTHPKLVEPRGSGGDAIGAWSPDGTMLVYSSGQFDGRELYLMNSDGSGVRRLTDWPGADGPVGCSPAATSSSHTPSNPSRFRDGSLFGQTARTYVHCRGFDGAGSPLDWIVPR